MMRSQFPWNTVPGFGLAQVLAEPVAEAGVGEYFLQRVGGKRFDRVEGRVGVKRVGALQREIEGQRLAGDLDVHAVAARLGCGAGVEHLDRAPRVLLVVERERRAHEDAPAVARGNLLHLGDGSGTGGDLDHSPAPLAHRADQRVEFADVADRRRHRDATMAGMIERIGGAEPDRALLHRLGDEALHFGHFIGGRLFAD